MGTWTCINLRLRHVWHVWHVWHGMRMACVARTCLARLNWPPMPSAASNSVTSCPRRAATVEHARPCAIGRGTPL